MQARSTSESLTLLVLEADAAEAAERVVAEAFAAGASGLEEREGSRAGAITLLVYVPAPQAEAVRTALASVAGVRTVSTTERVVDVDWSQAWRAGLAPIVVSEELVVRSSGVCHTLTPGQAELEIDPGQAFGTGGHESTRLSLDLLAGLPRSLRAGMRALDVGTGSGVLALAALRLGARQAVGVDVDAVAVAVARENAARNGLEGQLTLIAGSLEALRAERFDLILANLLKRELLPLLPALPRYAGPGTRLVVSGLLTEEGDEVRDGLAAVGFRFERSRELRDASGTAWLGLLLVA